MTVNIIQNLNKILNNFKALFDRESRDRFKTYQSYVREYNGRIYRILVELKEYMPVLRDEKAGTGFIVGKYCIGNNNVWFWTNPVQKKVSLPKDVEEFYAYMVKYFESIGAKTTTELKRVIDFVTAFKKISGEK